MDAPNAEANAVIVNAWSEALAYQVRDSIERIRFARNIYQLFNFVNVLLRPTIAMMSVNLDVGQLSVGCL